MAKKCITHLYVNDSRVELFSLRTLKNMIDKELGEIEEAVSDEQKGFQPTKAEKIQDNSDDGKLHISIKKKKLKYNLNC